MKREIRQIKGFPPMIKEKYDNIRETIEEVKGRVLKEEGQEINDTRALEFICEEYKNQLHGRHYLPRELEEFRDEKIWYPIWKEHYPEYSMEDLARCFNTPTPTLYRKIRELKEKYGE